MEEQTGGSKGKFLDVSFGRRCGRKLWKTINGKTSSFLVNLKVSSAQIKEGKWGEF